MKHILMGFIAFYLLPVCAACSIDEPPIVGAIRWDGWYGNGNVVKAVEATLGQPKYHFRLPWFSIVMGNNNVSINGDSPMIMDKEIEYASQAGLNYWAFVDYLNEAPGMSIALNRYIAATEKKGVHYCLIEEGSRLDKIGTNAWGTLLEHFRSPDYQTVLDGQQLLFVFEKTTTLGKSEWDDLKRLCATAGLKTPYLVLMGTNAEKERESLGFDAVSSYAAAGNGYTMDPKTYSQLTSYHVCREMWEKWNRNGTQCITFATAGWDTRPRQERPPFWCNNIVKVATPDPTPPTEQKPLIDAATATLDEIAAHMEDAIEWTKANRNINPANTIIIYAWNEHDEGGWIQPTLGIDGQPNDGRIKSLSKILRRNATNVLRSR